MPLRISGSAKLGPFRVRLPVPLPRRGRTWVSAGTRTPFGWLNRDSLPGEREEPQ
jgi:hypothetical protein